MLKVFCLRCKNTGLVPTGVGYRYCSCGVGEEIFNRTPIHNSILCSVKNCAACKELSKRNIKLRDSIK